MLLKFEYANANSLIDDTVERHFSSNDIEVKSYESAKHQSPILYICSPSSSSANVHGITNEFLSFIIP